MMNKYVQDYCKLHGMSIIESNRRGCLILDNNKVVGRFDKDSKYVYFKGTSGYKKSDLLLFTLYKKLAHRGRNESV